VLAGARFREPAAGPGSGAWRGRPPTGPGGGRHARAGLLPPRGVPSRSLAGAKALRPLRGGLRPAWTPPADRLGMAATGSRP